MDTSSRDLSKLRIDRKDSMDDSPNKSSGAIRAIFFCVCGMVAGFLILKAFQPDPAQFPASTPAVKAESLQPPTGGLRENTPGPAAVSATTLDATGYVVAQRKAAVSSKATGRLEQLMVKEGDVVKEGDTIGILENADARAIVAEREAALHAAETRVASAVAELEDSRRQRDRIAAIDDQRAVSMNDRDTIESRFRKATADLEGSKANVVVERARLEKTKVDLDYTIIRAPFAGTVLSKNADIGEVVAPFGSAANARGAVVTLADMDSLQVEADVSEANLAKVRIGQHCSITLDSYPDKRYEGEVGSIVPTVDRAKATVTVKIRFLNKDARVIPEMSAKVTFQL